MITLNYLRSGHPIRDFIQPAVGLAFGLAALGGVGIGLPRLQLSYLWTGTRKLYSTGALPII
jgi:hypothetical protein